MQPSLFLEAWPWSSIHPSTMPTNLLISSFEPIYDVPLTLFILNLTMVLSHEINLFFFFFLHQWFVMSSRGTDKKRCSAGLGVWPENDDTHQYVCPFREGKWTWALLLWEQEVDGHTVINTHAYLHCYTNIASPKHTLILYIFTCEHPYWYCWNTLSNWSKSNSDLKIQIVLRRQNVFPFEV